MSTIRETSNLALTVLVGQLAPEFGVNPDNVSVIANGAFRGVSANRYSQDGVEKFLVTLGKEFLDTMDALDVKGMVGILRQALSLLKTSQSLTVKTPIVAVQESDFTYEYVVRAKHRTGLILSRVSNRPDILSMKQSIHEEAATVVGYLIQERGK